MGRGKMRVVAISEPGGPGVLRLEERAIPQPGRSEIRVRVHASALNRADLLQRAGRYPAPPGFPADVPGLEFAGEVDAVGEGAGLWSVGSRVMGITGGGAHAEYVCIHEREAIRVPPGMELESAAAIPEAFMTAHDALIGQLDIQVGERVLIHAVASGVGTAALQLARVAGAITLGTSRSPGKLAKAATLGLEHALSAEHWVERVEEITGGAGVQAVLDLVGGDYVPNDLRILAVRGRVVVAGLVAGQRAQLDLGLLLRKRLHLAGTVLRSRPLEEKISLAREFSDAVVPLFASGRIRPVVDHVFGFAEIAEAHRRMEANDSFGKLVLRW